ncbi:MAG TPA: YCF48-related protein [Xanthobacteraceae bacterium]|nr:YCF48-related protein [Xanthobacteraceae bacterium]HZT36700.1 YCF48-related protein [Bryobacteraceae bacterium]
MLARKRRFCAWLRTIAIVALTATTTATSFSAIGATVGGAQPWQALYGVAIRPDRSIYIVGSKALLMVSEDHGKTWNEQTLRERAGNTLFQDRDLYAIRFTPDGKDGWIAGEMGIVLHSADGGKTWTRQATGVESNLFNVSAVDAQHAYACGANGVFVSTADGGQHWTVYRYKDPIIFFDVHFADPENGWMVGEFETILRTTDGGKTWNISHGGNVGDFTIGPSFSIVFSDPRHALVTGLNGEILTTADGGRNWTATRLPEPVATYSAAVTSGHFWLGGEGGRMLGLDPTGKWVVDRPTFNDIAAVAFAGQVGYAVGLDGVILRTNDAGETWQVVK